MQVKSTKVAKAKVVAPPQPPSDEEDDEDAQYSEPEEIDNDAINAMAEEQEEGVTDDEDDDDGDDADGMVDDDDDAAAVEAAPATDSSKKTKKSKKSASFIIPTSDEMSSLRQTEELYQTNLFKLGLEELLKEISVDYSIEGRLKKLEPTLHGIKQKIDAIQTTEVRAGRGAHIRTQRAFGRRRTRTYACTVSLTIHCFVSVSRVSS